MYKLPEAPLSIGGILDDGFKLFRATWRQLLPVAIVATVIGAIPQLMIAGLLEIKPGEEPSGPLLGGGAIATFAILILLSTVAYGVMLAGVDAAARTGASSLGAAFSIGLRRAPAVIGTSLLAMLALMIGFILLVVPGLYLLVALYPAFILPVAEKLGPIQSFTRARSLIKGSWWRTAGVLGVLSVVLIALFAIVSVATGFAMAPFVAGEDPQAAGSRVMAIQFIASLVMAPLLPLTYCIMYAVYTDLRLRKDGGDLLERVAAAGA